MCQRQVRSPGAVLLQLLRYDRAAHSLAGGDPNNEWCSTKTKPAEHNKKMSTTQGGTFTTHIGSSTFASEPAEPSHRQTADRQHHHNKNHHRHQCCGGRQHGVLFPPTMNTTATRRHDPLDRGDCPLPVAFFPSLRRIPGTIAYSGGGCIGACHRCLGVRW